MLSPELWFYIQGAPEDSPGLPELFLTPFDAGWECNMRMAGKGIMYICIYIGWKESELSRRSKILAPLPLRV